MLWLILTIILGIIGIGAFVIGAGSTGNDKIGPYAVSGISALTWLILTFFLCVHTVGQTQVGIVYNFSGTIAGKRSPGVVFTMPWQHIKTESIAVTKDTFTFEGTNSAVSKDQQPITASIVVNYQVSPQDVIGLFKTVGTNWQATLLDGRVPQDFKETTALFTSPQITLNRALLHDDVLKRLRTEMCPNTPDKPWCVSIVDVFISNVSYSQAYTNAIEAKQVQVQQAEQAQAKVAQARAEAEQNVALARGKAEAVVLAAKAQAQSLALKGKALKDNPQILQLEAIDKLSPNASVIICTGKTCPSILPSAATQSQK